MIKPIGRKRAPSRLERLILDAAENLFPGYFALVMATGVVSIAAQILGYPLFSRILLGVNWIAYIALWFLTLLRLRFYRKSLMGDLFDHQRAPGFFTLVAGTCVLGTQCKIVADAQEIAEILWYVGLGLWTVVMYAFFTAVTVRERKPSLAAGINGVWLIAAVATQSTVVLRGVLDLQRVPAPQIRFLCLTMFMIGCMLYLAIITMIFYRLTFIRLATRDFGPPYWINMGAVAITALAGSTLIMASGRWRLLSDYVPFLKGFTLFSSGPPPHGGSLFCWHSWSGAIWYAGTGSSTSLSSGAWCSRWACIRPERTSSLGRSTCRSSSRSPR